MFTLFQWKKTVRTTTRQRATSWKPRLEVLEDRTVLTTLNPGDILVADRYDFRGVIRVDPTTGTQTTISSGDKFIHAADVALDSTGNLLVVDFGARAVIRVDPTTGAQTTVSSNGSFVVPWGIAIDPAGNILVADLAAFGGNGGIIRVDPTTGVQTTVSAGDNFVEPARLTTDAAGNILVTDADAFGGNGGVIRVDPVSGAQTVLSSGGFFVQPAGITIDSAGNLLVADIQAFGTGAVIRVNTLTGTQTVVASGNSSLIFPHGLATDTAGNILVVMNQDASGGRGGIIRVDPMTGAQTTVSSGDSFVDIIGIAVVPEAECVPAPPGLVAWWSGEGDATDRTGQHDGTLINGVTFAPGRVGQAFSLDGIDDYIRVPHDPVLNPANGLTIEAWINSASTVGPRVIASKWNDNTSDWSYIFKDHNSSDKLRIELSKNIHNDLADLSSTTSIPLGTWVHVAATFDGNTVRLYFNGALDASLSVAPELIDTSTTDFLIGAGVTADGSVRENFAGLIDELGIYNRALTQEEIESIYRAGSAGKCLNRPPVADAGGPYTIQEGDALSLSAVASTDPDGDALTYSWDVNGDGVFDDATGVNPTLSWAQLQALGIDDGPGVFAVSARVDDGHVAVDSPAVPLTVNNTPPSSTLSSSGPIDEGSAAVVSFGETSDPSLADRAAGFHYTFALSEDALATSYGAAGTAMFASFTFEDNGAYTVYGRVFDKDGDYTSSQTTVLVNNVAPQATVIGPSDGVRYQPRTFTFSASDPSPDDQAAGFTFNINWGDSSTQTVSGLSGLQIDHAFARTGTYSFQVTATDKDSGVSEVATSSIVIGVAQLQSDPNDPGKTVLVVGGTSRSDEIRFSPARRGGGIEVTLNHASQGTFTPTGRIIAYGGAGNDEIQVSDRIHLPAFLYGGTGNDILVGGAGNNVLVGGDGDDVLVGRGHRDVLIGGTGRDVIIGLGEQDILIAGHTAFDANDAALFLVLSEWTSPRDYQTRVANLRGEGSGPRYNGEVFLKTDGPDVTVFNDDSRDLLVGNRGRDWYFAHRDTPIKDKIVHLHFGEFVDDIG